MEIQELFAWFLIGFGVMFIGISKAGFGGGMGMLTVPICAVGLTELGKDTMFAIGFLLPLLCLGDGISLWHYRKKWNWDSVKNLIPGAVVGIVIGAILMNRVSPKFFQLLLGLIAITFVIFHILRSKIIRVGESSKKKESGLLTWLIGTVAGLTSTFAHGAGPVIAIYLIPKNLPKGEFVGTNALIFSIINWLKVPFFFFIGAINVKSLMWNAGFFLFVPLGVFIGIFLHGRVSESLFKNIVLVTTFLAGGKLLYSGLLQ